MNHRNEIVDAAYSVLIAARATHHRATRHATNHPTNLDAQRLHTETTSTIAHLNRLLELLAIPDLREGPTIEA